MPFPIGGLMERSL